MRKMDWDEAFPSYLGCEMHLCAHRKSQTHDDSEWWRCGEVRSRWSDFCYKHEDRDHLCRKCEEEQVGRDSVMKYWRLCEGCYEEEEDSIAHFYRRQGL